ncbi:uncharacterized protein L969DRAFT_90947 [Mixia osmundae IAM 14324]|uniref:Amine oxidase domain-containing protein n=1 Tax=Mixia osmundae (strain CBS 9802 / IAM 14324 / JCM 22182 / KY 12970) TaxID=764103 RepID=G7EB45_MIXOS|nr:uncharacterized protein L969DRAFT_90947 [Mixia osmundae IAM 14324]KEI36576.1 hypothetical protein L969DRAFT_90947 [Mixia osmundae IAM 14324]GAB00056.1 hypothetical protein E5Q_06758 [Mixia osmundae IAM 14324]
MGGSDSSSTTATSDGPPRKRIIIVGAGASGMSTAYALSLSPQKFDVTVYEMSSNAGGMATSYDLSKSMSGKSADAHAQATEKYGSDYINDGVQGASPQFYNTFKMFNTLGFTTSEVGMQIAFGKDKDTFWTNVFPSDVVDRYAGDIKKFGTALKVIKMFEPVFALISVQAMLKMFRFSEGFGNVMLLPLVALFFGTGNQTPFISSAILERVFMDPSMKLFEYSPDSLLASIPEMRSFPRLSKVYEAWTKEAESRGNVRVVCGRQVLSVKRTSGKNGLDGVTLVSRDVKDVDNNLEIVGPGKEHTETFDELVLACDADSALKILGKDASWKEKKILGNVKYLWDVTYTHSDLDYMEKYYKVRHDPEMRSGKRDDDEEAQKQYKFAEKNWEPLYFIHTYPEDQAKIEMSFDLTVYQAQFKGESVYGPEGKGYKNERDGDDEATHKGRKIPMGKAPPLEQHVFQTIFLDRDNSSHLWTKDDIAEDKIILKRWWKQQSHRWQHYGGTVAWMWSIQGKNHTHYAGAWSVLNMNELAVCSGFAAAYQLGAPYPFKDDSDCKRLFSLYLALGHLSRMRSEDRKGFFA